MSRTSPINCKPLHLMDLNWATLTVGSGKLRLDTAPVASYAMITMADTERRGSLKHWQAALPTSPRRTDADEWVLASTGGEQIGKGSRYLRNTKAQLTFHA